MDSVIMTTWWHAIGAVSALAVVATVLFNIYAANNEITYVEVVEAEEDADYAS